MSVTNPYGENYDSQGPASRLLQKLGYRLLTKEEVEKQRKGRLSAVLLEDILEAQLQKINHFEYKGNTYPFSRGNILSAINILKNIPNEGLKRTAESAYNLLTLGSSFEETIQGDKKSYHIQYIDWNHIHNNVFHLTEEMEVKGIHQTRRCDIVLFINGIPIAVLENKRRDKNFSVDKAVEQLIKYQTKEDGIPRLFYYAQLLLGVNPNKVKYGVTATKKKFYSIWKEEGVEAKVQKILYSNINGLNAEERLPTQQDQNLYSLCRKERLMELIYQYIVFDQPDKKIARYQQYFAVQSTIKTIRKQNKEGKRKGGVIWHTQGSGKSLTMVMLAKAIALEEDILNGRVIIVTDRINLDKQIHKTFYNCGKHPVKAKSGQHLVDLIVETRTEIMTTVINKFDSAIKRKAFVNASSNIFVLVDESHRSHYGPIHTSMKKVLPNACYIGFTGTPLMKKNKTTTRKFGGYIHKYTIDEAVRDGAVLPLIYEGRAAKLTIDKKKLDRDIGRVFEPLEQYANQEEHEKELKKRFASISEIYQSDKVIEEIAYDLSKHFTENWQNESYFKAQLAVPTKITALKYLDYFENQHNPKLKINAKVIISAPDQREGSEDVFKARKEDEIQQIQAFWTRMMDEYGSKEQYEETIIQQFKEPTNTVELLIVVDKLLTGFDAPNNTILYLAKPLREHNLLQAIARVNRLFEGKEHGFIIDYVGLLGDLDHALTMYSALEGFEEGDLKGALNQVEQEVEKIKQRYADLLDIFKEVNNQKDNEALERHLAPQDIRDLFYKKLSAFARCLQLCLSTDTFYQKFNEKQIAHYRQTFKKFQSLRNSVKERYNEIVDYKEYKNRIRKLLNDHIGVEDMEQIIEPLELFNEALRKGEVEKHGTPASVADKIAHRMKKEIIENLEKDEAFYQKFSDLVEAAIENFRNSRLSEKEYLEEVMGIYQQYTEGSKQELPEAIKDRPEARAFYGKLKALFENKIFSDELLAHWGASIDDIVQTHLIRDWHHNHKVHKDIEDEVEDFILDSTKKHNISIEWTEIDDILRAIIDIAKYNYANNF